MLNYFLGNAVSSGLENGPVSVVFKKFSAVFVRELPITAASVKRVISFFG